MKKEYLKPGVEFIQFKLKAPIANDFGDYEGEMGSGDLPEGWD